jgi:hypothetical protein
MPHSDHIAQRHKQEHKPGKLALEDAVLDSECKDAWARACVMGNSVSRRTSATIDPDRVLAVHDLLVIRAGAKARVAAIPERPICKELRPGC